MNNQIVLETPRGKIKASTDIVQMGDTPNAEEDVLGIVIEINGVTAAIVEWDADHRNFTLRTYNVRKQDPQHYHTWDGEEIPR